MAEKKKKRTDGYYSVSFRVNGKRYYAYGKTQKEANQKAEEKKQELANKVYIKSSEMTFAQYYEQWIELKTGTVKEITIFVYNQSYKVIAGVALDNKGNTLADIKIKDIEPQHIKTLQKILANRNNSNTVNQRIMFVSSVLNDAMKERAINWNPCNTVKNLKRTETRATETKHRALSKEETRAFFDCAANINSWYLNLYKFLLLTDCRIGEAAALKYNDLDYKKNVVHIRRTMTRDTNGNSYIGKTTKSKDGIRDIPITQEIKKVLESQRELVKMRGLGLRIDGIIFVSFRNDIINKSTIGSDIEKICRLANITHFSAHAFRDTFATRAIESGMNPKTLQNILGHSKINMTMDLYAHVMEDTKAKEMQLVDVAL